MKEKIINLLGIRKKVMMCRIKDSKLKNEFIYMESITDEQENSIDELIEKEENYKFKFKDNLILSAKSIYLYGKIDFSDKNDLNAIEKFNIIDDNGNNIYANFDYEKGIATTIDNKVKTYFTFDPILWFKYCHCLLGKPEKIIVYNVKK